MQEYVFLSAVDCGAPPISEGAVQNHISVTSYQSTAVYTCLAGAWFTRGVYSMVKTCSARSLWEPEDIKCQGEITATCLLFNYMYISIFLRNYKRQIIIA